MTDLTPVFDEFLSSRSAPLTKRSFSVDKLDDFLREAYTIHSAIKSLHSDLLSIRQAYLSTAQPRRTLIRSAQHDRTAQPLTTREREEVDANAKQMLRELNAKIRQLEDAENIRQETEMALVRKKFGRGLGGLGAWAAGGGQSSKSVEQTAAEEKASSVNTHRKGVLLTLTQRLEACGKTQHGMMEARLMREMEKNQSVLAKASAYEAGGMVGTQEPSSPAGARRRASHALPPGEAPTPYNPSGELTAEQIQMFEQENHDMLRHYESALDQIRTTQKSLIEIDELQTQLVSHLATQSAHIDQLVTDSFNTTENVGGGNKQLKKATQKPSPAKYTFYATCGICTFLIVWDLLI